MANQMLTLHRLKQASMGQPNANQTVFRLANWHRADLERKEALHPAECSGATTLT